MLKLINIKMGRSNFFMIIVLIFWKDNCATNDIDRKLQWEKNNLNLKQY